jgi:formate dehydrogenase iron-sulfur subunit
MTGKGMLIDTSKCTACRACQVTCKQWHSLPAEDTYFTGSYTNPPDNSGANLTVVKFIEAEVAGNLRFLFFNNRCRHCNTPSCKGACPFGAIKRQADGIVRIVKAKCTPRLCTASPLQEPKPCQANCPFHIPKWKYYLNGKKVGAKMKKCDFCFNRMNTSPQALVLKDSPQRTPGVKYVSTDGLTKSALPACQVTCPPGAIITGDIGDIETAAANKVSYLQANGYPYANVYPVDIQTHVKWVLLENPEVYGLEPY